MTKWAFKIEQNKNRRQARRERGLCWKCGINAPHENIAMCIACRQKDNAKRRELRDKAISSGKCGKCLKNVPPAGLVNCDKCRGGLDKKMRAEGAKRWRAALRHKTFQAYGGCCNCCGETEELFLEVDHINGGGAKHREQENLRAGTSFYGWLAKKNYPADFQILCRNCNYGRYRNGGECPHKCKKEQSA